MFLKNSFFNNVCLDYVEFFLNMEKNAKRNTTSFLQAKSNSDIQKSEYPGILKCPSVAKIPKYIDVLILLRFILAHEGLGFPEDWQLSTPLISSGQRNSGFCPVFL